MSFDEKLELLNELLKYFDVRDSENKDWVITKVVNDENTDERYAFFEEKKREEWCLEDEENSLYA